MMPFILGIVLTHTQMLQTAKTSAFIEVVTLANNQLIKHIWFTARAPTYLLDFYGNSKDVFSFSQTLFLHFDLVFVK